MSCRTSSRPVMIAVFIICIATMAFAEDVKTISNSIGMKLVLIVAGEFEMGSNVPAKTILQKLKTPNSKFWNPSEDDLADEFPLHRVHIAKAFYLGQDEVTVGNFRSFVVDTGYVTQAESDGGGRGFDESTGQLHAREPRYNWKVTGVAQTEHHPVTNVSWNDAKKFCEWLSKKEGETYRLPTEAEWEYSCKAGTKTLFHNGDAPETLAEVANIADGTLKSKFGEKFRIAGADWPAIKTNDGYVFTAPVGSFAANKFGLHDMHGNVREWCEDFKQSYSNRTAAKSDLDTRVLRGGSWRDTPIFIRSSSRNSGAPNILDNTIGFRVVRE